MPTDDHRARESELAGLHGVFAKFLSAKLASGEVSAAELNCIRQFLKDNGIDCVGQTNPDINSIVSTLPTFENMDDGGGCGAGDGDRILN